MKLKAILTAALLASTFLQTTSPLAGGPLNSAVSPLLVPTPAKAKATANGDRIEFDPLVLENRREALYCLNPFMMEEARNMIRQFQPEMLKSLGCGVVKAHTKVRWLAEIGTELTQVIVIDGEDDHPIWVKTDAFKNEMEWAQHDVCDLLDKDCLAEVAQRFNVQPGFFHRYDW